MNERSAAVVREAHQELLDIYTAAIVAARNFSIKGQSALSHEATALACDATRMRAAIEEAAEKNLVDVEAEGVGAV